MLEYAFAWRALIAGVLLAAAGGYWGAFVIQRRLGFLTDGLAHAAFGSVGAALLLGWPPLAIALPGTLAAALGIVAVSNRTKLANDTAIGVFFATSVALGMALLSRKAGSTGDAMAYLFGSISLIGGVEIALAVGVALATALTVRWWGAWALEGCDAELARTDGLDPRRGEFVLAGALALVIVSSIKLVGAVLAMAFLIVPAATARLWCRTFLALTVSAVGIGCCSVVLGLHASYWFDLPCGPSIVLSQAACFFASVALRGTSRRA
ncbi:MAG: metal ABC transporter permease [Fimbriimonadales bacterium]|nr:metal ABC transporter permease [Fimbriimonadales bacterium]